MRLLIGLFIFAILLSCSENKQEESKPQHALKEIKPLFDDEIAYENEIRNIDSDKRLTEVTSLEYLSGEGKSFVVKGLVETKQDDQVMTLKKLTFKQVFKNGNESTCSYYYLGTRKFASTCEQSILTGNDLKKVLTKSYYNDSSEVFFSKRIFKIPSNSSICSGENSILSLIIMIGYFEIILNYCSYMVFM